MITIQNGTLLCGEDLHPAVGNLFIQDNEIVEISDGRARGKVIDAKGCLVAPALINSHIHLGDSVARDEGDGAPLDEIVKPPNGIKHRILRETSREDLIKFMEVSLKDMIQTGTTTFVDFREGGVEGVEILNEALQDIPIRAIILGRQDSFQEQHVNKPQLDADIQKILEISQGIGISGFGEVEDEVATQIAQECLIKGKIPAIHAAENEEVQLQSLKNTGKTEIERALEAGFKLLIHLTSATTTDLKKVTENNVSVATCPRANGALSSGIPPIREMWDLGINLLLGTDNVMINSPDMFREMEYALKVTRGFTQKYFSPVEILKMATVNAGKAVGLNLGSLEEGNLADIMIVERISRDPILSLINRTQSKNIIGLITDGRILYQR